MNDLDMLYDYYTMNNLAVGGFAAVVCRIKNDKLEKVFRNLVDKALEDNQEAAEMIIRLGGKVY